MFLYARPYLQRLAPHLLRNGRISERALAAVCAVHHGFGAFIAGTLMPHELRQLILDR